MKNRNRLIRFFACLCLVLSIIKLTYAQEHHHHQFAPEITPTIKVIPINIPNRFVANQPRTVKFQLQFDKRILNTEDLKEVHTQKIHVLVIDSSLKDYHHLHPQELRNSKTFQFSFTPGTSNSYKMWVDVTPLSTNKQVFIESTLTKNTPYAPVTGETNLSEHIGPYSFNLNFDRPLKSGQTAMATMTINKEGKPFNRLEPVMGAFAHLVGFTGDHSSILHIHPMGKEPQSDADRGGPQLMFHLELQKPGFIKLFAQFRIDGQDIFVPFSINVT